MKEEKKQILMKKQETLKNKPKQRKNQLSEVIARCKYVEEMK